MLRVEQNGFVLWSRADDLMHERSQRNCQARRRRVVAGFDPASPGPYRCGTLRGWLGPVCGCSKCSASISKHGRGQAQKRLKTRARRIHRAVSGVARWRLADLKALSGSLPGGATPLLVFLHGTASSTTDNFGGLWDRTTLPVPPLRSRLNERYGERAYALQHRSLTESPIENALALARALPAGAEVHLVSHSRGGLIGELLCLGMRDANTARLDSKADRHLVCRRPHRRRADRPVAAGSTPPPPRRDHVLKRPRGRSRTDRCWSTPSIPASTRFVRVACLGARHHAGGRGLDRWLSMMDFISAAACLPRAVDFC